MALSPSAGTSIINSINAGLNNTYAYLASLYPKDGVTSKNIAAAQKDNTNYLTLNQPFAAYLQNNFATLDKDKDGKISAKEMEKFTQTLSTSGITRNELTQLAASGAFSTATINKILEHFNDIDKNHDGRVSNAEIAAYTYDSQKQEKLDQANYRKATSDMTVFYGSESSSEPDSYSLLSYKYKD